MKYLNDLFDTIIVKDIITRYNICDVDILKRLLYYVTEQCGQAFSARSVVRFLKKQNRSVSVDTILNYLQYCEEAFLIRRIQRYNVGGKQASKVDENKNTMTFKEVPHDIPS